MQKDSYLILGVSENATEEEITSAYETLRKKYFEERFLPGEAGSDASQKLQELNVAYEDIKIDFNARKAMSNTTDFYGEIEALVKSGKTEDAQRRLDELADRPAEWHYLQSIIFYRKNWYSESKKQLEFACQLDPSNPRYSDALLRLNNMMTSNQGAHQNQSNPNYNPNQANPGADPNRQMGGCGSELNCCSNLICADCCCEMMGGDLIPCC